MRGLVFDGQALRVDSDLPVPTPQSDEALLRMRRAGVCNTDLEITRGYMGFTGVLGHEFVAEVVEGPDHLLGRRVVGEINVACQTCAYCQQGIPSQCSRRTTVGIDRHPGAFANYLALATRNLYPVPDGVSDDQAVFVEPLAAALQMLEAVHIAPRDRVVLIGAGKLGLLCAQVVRLLGVDLTVIVRRERPARLLDRWGIPSVGLDDVSPRSADVVIDCTGTADGFDAALQRVRPRGTLILKSTYAGLPQANLSRVVVDEIRVVGSRCGPFAAALRLLAAGLVDCDSLIDGRYALEEGLAAFEAAGQPGALKFLLDFEGA